MTRSANPLRSRHYAEFEVEVVTSHRHFTGVVEAGRGLGAPRMTDPVVHARLRDLLGFPVEPGTLNLRLSMPWDRALTPWYLAAEEITVGWRARTAQAGYFWSRVLIAGRYRGVVAQADEPGYPVDLVELLSEVHLRETLHLKNGDAVSFIVVANEELGGGTHVMPDSGV